MWTNIAIAGLIVNIFMASLGIAGHGESGVGDDRVDVVVSNPDLEQLVGSIGGAMVDVHSLQTGGALDSQAISRLGDPELLVLLDSEKYSIEKELIEAFPDVDIIDWPNYEFNGVKLRNFTGFDDSRRGFWLDFENAKGIATAIGGALMVKGVEPEIVGANLHLLKKEFDNLAATSSDAMQATGRPHSTWLAANTEAAYIIANLGLIVADSPLTVGGEPVDEIAMNDLEIKLINGNFAGIVCPESADQKIKDAVAQLSKESKAPVAYVKYPGDDGAGSFLSTASYNLSIMTNAAVEGEYIRKSQESLGYGSANVHFIWAIVVFGLAMWIVMLNKQLHYRGGVGTLSGRGMKSKAKK